MSFLKRVLSREPIKKGTSVPPKTNQISIKVENIPSTKLKKSKLFQRNFQEKSPEKYSTSSPSSLKKPPLSVRKLPIYKSSPEIPQLHISLKFLSTPVSTVVSPRIKKANPQLIVKPNDFIEPEVETDIPTLKEYMENTTKSRLNVSFADTATDSASKRSASQVSRSFIDDNAVEKIPERSNSLKNIKEKDNLARLKEMLGINAEKEVKPSTKNKLIEEKNCKYSNRVMIYKEKGSRLHKN
ncbi:unnamed protein product [Blepharisma stoltei]|uniref:Uncharacterized protein n=1 Tax=Blepharisma stoltei TaxID=1481888 RepID=A0AAU9IHF2_9CILI|nr:unnamed protein product [Blepharisma stoltei]